MMFESISTLRHDRDVAREQAILQEAQVLEKVIKGLISVLGGYAHRIPEKRINPCRRHPFGIEKYFDRYGIVAVDRIDQGWQIILWINGELGLLRSHAIWDGQDLIGSTADYKNISFEDALGIVSLDTLLFELDREMEAQKTTLENELQAFNLRLQRAKQIEEEL